MTTGQLPSCPVCGAVLSMKGADAFRGDTCSKECARTIYIAYVIAELTRAVDSAADTIK